MPGKVQATFAAMSAKMFLEDRNQIHHGSCLFWRIIIEPNQVDIAAGGTIELTKALRLVKRLIGLRIEIVVNDIWCALKPKDGPRCCGLKLEKSHGRVPLGHSIFIAPINIMEFGQLADPSGVLLSFEGPVSVPMPRSGINHQPN